MNKYISIIIIGVLLITAIISLIKIFKNIRKSKSKFFNNGSNVALVVLFIITTSFFVISFNNFILYFKIEKFGNEIHSIVSSYKDIKGEYPTNSTGE